MEGQESLAQELDSKLQVRDSVPIQEFKRHLKESEDFTEDELKSLDELNAKQLHFVQLCFNRVPRSEAARQAGYNSVPESVPVQKALAAMTRRYARVMGMTKDDVILGMLDAVDMAENSTELRAAWREIGLLIGAYEATKHEVTFRLDTDSLKTASDARLAQMLRGEVTVIDAAPDEVGVLIEGQSHRLLEAMEAPVEVEYEEAEYEDGERKEPDA